MQEQPETGMDHHHAVLVRGDRHLVVAQGLAILDPAMMPCDTSRARTFASDRSTTSLTADTSP